MNSLKSRFLVLVCLFQFFNVQAAHGFFGGGLGGMGPSDKEISGVLLLGTGLVTSVVPFFHIENVEFSPALKALPRIKQGKKIELTLRNGESLGVLFQEYGLLDKASYEEQCQAHFAAKHLDPCPLELGSIITLVGRYSVGHEISGEFIGFSRDQILLRRASGKVMRLSNLDLPLIRTNRLEAFDISPWAQSAPPARELIRILVENSSREMSINDIGRIRVRGGKMLHFVGLAMMATGSNMLD